MNMHKMDGTQTYHLAKEMIPVYAIAITQERYFEDDRMYHLFSLRDDEFACHPFYAYSYF